MKMTVQFGGEKFIVKPLYSRDGKRRLCGSMGCHFCKCHLRTVEGKPEGWSRKRGGEVQGLVRCPEPCKRIHAKCAHLCKFGEVYFVRERNPQRTEEGGTP